MRKQIIKQPSHSLQDKYLSLLTKKNKSEEAMFANIYFCVNKKKHIIDYVYICSKI